MKITIYPTPATSSGGLSVSSSAPPAVLVQDSDQSDLLIPGPPGVAGPAGAAGAIGVPGLDGESTEGIPGPTGALP